MLHDLSITILFILLEVILMGLIILASFSIYLKVIKRKKQLYRVRFTNDYVCEVYAHSKKEATEKAALKASECSVIHFDKEISKTERIRKSKSLALL